MERHIMKVKVGEEELIFETGKIARQANGAVLIRSGETMVFTTACATTSAAEKTDFLPLRIDYQEKLPFPAQLVDESLAIEAALGEEVEQAWLHFLHSIEVLSQTDPASMGLLERAWHEFQLVRGHAVTEEQCVQLNKQFGQFKEVMQLLKELGATSSWMAMRFDIIRSQAINPYTAFQQVMEEFDPKTLTF